MFSAQVEKHSNRDKTKKKKCFSVNSSMRVAKDEAERVSVVYFKSPVVLRKEKKAVSRDWLIHNNDFFWVKDGACAWYYCHNKQQIQACDG